MSDRFPTFRRWLYDFLALEFPSLRVFPRWTTRWQQISVLRLLAVAIEERLPVADVLRAWAVDQQDPQRRRVRRLAESIDAGAPLVEALEQSPGVVSDDDLLALRVGAQSGTLTASLKAVVERAEFVERERGISRGKLTAYVMAFAAYAFAIVSFLQIKIVPAFLAILEDFQVQAPEILQSAISFARLFERYWWAPVLLIAGAAWAGSSPTARRFLRDRIATRWFRPLRTLRSAQVLECLGVASAAGRPMAGALSTLARHHYDPSTRQKLLFARNETEHGVDAWDSLNLAGVITQADVRAIVTAEHVGNRSWTLGQLAETKRRRTYRFLAACRQLLLPAVVVTLGAFVLFQALAIFVPLVDIIMAQL
jgi:type IV pilus assembly protein PilC